MSKFYLRRFFAYMFTSPPAVKYFYLFAYLFTYLLTTYLHVLTFLAVFVWKGEHFLGFWCSFCLSMCCVPGSWLWSLSDPSQLQRKGELSFELTNYQKLAGLVQKKFICSWSGDCKSKVKVLTGMFLLRPLPPWLADHQPSCSIFLCIPYRSSISARWTLFSHKYAWGNILLSYIQLFSNICSE